MKAMMKKTAALLMAGVLAAGALTGCGQKNTDYATTVVATYGDTPIYLDEANFMARYNQWYNELYYMGYFGEGMWGQDIGGKTLEAATKEDVMAALLQTEALIAHAEEYGVSLTDADMEKVNQACSDFFEQESAKLVEATGATEELVKRIYEKNALANKVWQAVVADTDTQVSLEESQQVGIRYILVREEAEPENAETGAAAETTAAEADGNGETAGSEEGKAAAAETPEAKANDIVSRIQAGEDIGDVAEELGLTCNTGHYAKHPAETGDEEGAEGTSSSDLLGTNAASMAVGEARAVYGESADGWYVIYCDTENDEEATENEVESIIRERKSARFAEVYAGWDKAEFKVDEDVWELVAFNGNPVYEEEPVTVGAESGETEAVTEASSAVGETTSAESETPAAETTAAGEAE